MLLTDLVAPSAIIPALKVNSKKQILQEVAAKAAELCDQSERAILDILQQREKPARPASATASPFRTASCQARQAVRAVCATGAASGFDALDGQPVDLVFLLLAPEAAGADHLKALARVARLLRDPEVTRKLRNFPRRRSALRRAGNAFGKCSVALVHTDGFDVAARCIRDGGIRGCR